MHLDVVSLYFVEDQTGVKNEMDWRRITETNLVRVAFYHGGCRLEGNAQYTRNLLVVAM
jgi:hypothetical protein